MMSAAATWESLYAVVLLLTVITSGTWSQDGLVRLQDGPNHHSGRVELNVMGEWSQICDDGWSLQDAIVVCRQLNLSIINVQAYGNSLYGTSNQSIFYDNFECSGTENKLTSCNRTTANCSNENTAGVDCQEGWPTICEQAGHTNCCTSDCKVVNTNCYCDNECWKFNDCCEGINSTCPSSRVRECTNGQVRLVGGVTVDEGRLEICDDGQWLTVCHEHWNLNNSAVVCREIGLDPNGAVLVSDAYYGQGNLSFVEKEFGCTGQEAMLAHCRPVSMVIDCGHQQDVGINCTLCVHGSVRLANGGPQTGQVEVCWMGKWSTICHDVWSGDDARIVCKQLGYSGYNSIPYGSSFGSARYPSKSINLQCSGNEHNITSCPANVSSDNCTEAQNFAGVQCFNDTSCVRAGLTDCCREQCKTGSCYCDSACLIYGDCCTDANQVCSAKHCTNGNVRLTQGKKETEGILQLCVNNQMDLVCTANWTAREAQVLCRSIGYPFKGALPVNSAEFGTTIHLTVVGGYFNCTGDEENVMNCQFTAAPSCDPAESVGVICKTICTEGEVRLVNGSNPYEGRVELCQDGEWGTVCDEGWSSNDAKVICRELNVTTIAAQSFSRGYFGHGLSERQILFKDSQCNGMEDNITLCPMSINTSSCTHAMDAGVKCGGHVGLCELKGLDLGFTGCCKGSSAECKVVISSTQSCYCDADCWEYNDCCADINNTCPEPECNSDNVAIRFVGGQHPLEGRVEVCVDGQWSTVCDDQWDVADARVICKQLQIDFTADAIAYSGSVFGEGSGPIRIGGFQCNATNTQILDCVHTEYPDCSHKHDAGVSCRANNCFENGAVQLDGGNSQFEGTVNVCVNGSWNTFCDSMWGNSDAVVVCRQLQYSTIGASGYIQSFFGSSVNAPGFSLFQCTGTEQSLTDCPHSTAADCNTDQLAGVKCTGSVGPCQSAGYVECCTSSNCTVVTSNGSCDCNTDCHTNNTCCSDINTICPLNMSVCNETTVRLVDGAADNVGRVEICMKQKWQTVCNIGWNSNDASVVCRELGYPAYDSAAINKTFPATSSPIGVTNVNCVGTENKLAECTYEPVYLNTSCIHQNDAGVRCSSCTKGGMRIVGASNNMGHVELCLHGDWVSVCASGWTIMDSNTVCSLFGYPINGKGSEILLVNSIAVKHAPTLVNVSQCNGTFTESCSVITENCQQLAGVVCQLPCTTGEARLIGGRNAQEGFVELCYNEVFGAVCDINEFSSKVICGQLGYSRVDASLSTCLDIFNTSAIATIQNKTIQCSGNETNVTLCSQQTYPLCSQEQLNGVQCAPKTACESHGFDHCCTLGEINCGVAYNLDTCYCDSNCSLYNDCCEGIQLTCPSTHCNNGDISLIGGSSTQDGHVRLCVNGTLGIICNDNWGPNETEVVCKQLGHPHTAATFSGQPYQGNLPYVAANVSCTSSEQHITSCDYFSVTCCPSDVAVVVQCAEYNSSSLIASSSPAAATTMSHSFLLQSTLVQDTIAASIVGGMNSSSINTAGTTITATSNPTPSFMDLALENTAEVILAMYTEQNFTGHIQRFKNITATAINNFCEHNMQLCTPAVSGKRNTRQRSTNTVRPEGIMITNTTNTATGLRVVLYALLTTGGVLPRTALYLAIQEAIGNGLYVGLGGIDVQNSNGLPVYVVIIAGTVGGVLAVGMVVTITAVCTCAVFYRQHQRQHNKKVHIQVPAAQGLRRTNSHLLSSKRGGTQENFELESLYDVIQGPIATYYCDYTEEPGYASINNEVKIGDLPEYFRSFNYNERITRIETTAV